jgi:hypothetical protein
MARPSRALRRRQQPPPPAAAAEARRPVHVTGRFSEGVTPDQLPQGSAILEIPDAKGEAFYWCEAVGRHGRILGVWLQKCGDGTRHYVHLDTAPHCTCADASYRPQRPGGCRHLNAVRQAMVELAKRTAAVAA